MINRKHCEDKKCNCHKATEVLNNLFGSITIELDSRGEAIINKKVNK